MTVERKQFMTMAWLVDAFDNPESYDYLTEEERSFIDYLDDLLARKLDRMMREKEPHSARS